MTTITRQYLELPAWRTGVIRTAAPDTIMRAQLPECPAWCWVDHDAGARELATTYVGEGDDAPRHASPWLRSAPTSRDRLSCGCPRSPGPRTGAVSPRSRSWPPTTTASRCVSPRSSVTTCSQ